MTSSRDHKIQLALRLESFCRTLTDLPDDHDLLQVWGAIEDYFETGWQLSPGSAIKVLKLTNRKNLVPPDNVVRLEHFRKRKEHDE